MILSIFTSVAFWIWFAIMIGAIVFEALTPSDLVSIWFAAGALVALIICVIWPDLVWLQVVVFFVVSGILIISTRKLAKKLQNTPDVKTNIDSIVGQTGKVTLEIQPHEIGEVKVEGKLWSAVADMKIEKDEYIEVVAVDGVKLVVTKLEENTESSEN